MIWDDQGAIATAIQGLTLQFVPQSSLSKRFDTPHNAPHNETNNASGDRSSGDRSSGDRSSGNRVNQTHITAVQNWLYELGWQAQPKTPPSVAADANTNAPWLIFSDAAGGQGTDGVGDRIATALQAQGETCVVVKAASQYEATSEQTYHINPTSSEDLERLFNDVMPSLITPQGDLSCRIVYGWALDMDESAVDRLAIQQSAWGGLLHVVQVLAQFPSLNAQLWLLTQATQTLDIPTPINLPAIHPVGLGSDPTVRTA